MIHLKKIDSAGQVPLMELDFIRAQDPLSSKIFVVVPEQFAFEAEKYLVEHLALKGLFHVRIYGFKKLLYELSHLVGVNSGDLISEFGKNVLLSDVLKKIDGELELYRSSYRSKSKVEMILSQLDAMRSEGMLPEDLLRLADGTSLSQGSLSKKLRELALIFAAYRRHFERERMDEIALASRLREYFLSEERDPLLEEYSLIVDSFSGMSDFELSLLTAMASKSEESFFRICCAPRGLAARYSQKFASQVESCLKRDKLPYEVEEIKDSKLSQGEENAYAFASLFDYEDRLAPYRPNFEVLRAKNREEELSFVALDILSKMRSGAYVWKDFAIVSASMEGYEYYVDKVLQSYKIPYFRDESISISAFDLVSFLSNSLKSLSNNYERSYVIEAMKGLAFFASEEDEARRRFRIATDLERYILSMNINYERLFRDRYFEALPGGAKAILHREESELYYREQLKFKNEFLKALKRLEEGLKEGRTWKEKLAHLDRYLESFAFRDSIERKMECYAELEDDEKLGKYAAIKKGIEEVFSQVEKLPEELEVETDYFIELFLSALSVYKAGISPPNTLKVLSGSIERSRFAEIKWLYIVGANEGILPSRRTSSQSVFSAAELSFLDEFSSFDFKTPLKFMDKEMFDLYEKILLAEEGSIFTYPVSDEKGKELKESNWIKNLKKKFGIAETEFVLNLNRIKAAGIEAPFYERIFLQCPPDKRDVTYFHDSFQEEFAAYRQAEERLFPLLSEELEEYVKRVTKCEEEKGIKTYHLSVSRLEKQALCPYSFFVEYALRPEQNRHEGFDYALVGSVFHKALEIFVNQFMQADDKDAFRAQAEEHLMSEFLAACEREEILMINTEFREKMDYYKPSIKHIASSLLSQFDSTDQVSISVMNEEEFEHEFRRDGTALSIRGRVDRLDLIRYQGRNYLRIVDYKTGAKKFDEKKIEEGTQLQLLTYLKALLEGKYSDAQALGAFYHSIREELSDGQRRNFDEDSGAKQFPDSYRLNGRYVEEEDLLKALDRPLSETKSSQSSSLKLTKEGRIAKNKKLLMDRDAFDELLSETEDKLWDLLEEIKCANIDVKLHDSKDHPCPYCGYNGILKLDKNRYRDRFNLETEADENLLREKGMEAEDEI